MLRVCIASIQNVERRLLLLVVSASDILYWLSPVTSSFSDDPWTQFTAKPFLPRDAMHKRGLCRHAVSVCLSVTFVDNVKTNKHIFEIFSTPFLFFHTLLHA